VQFDRSRFEIFEQTYIEAMSWHLLLFVGQVDGSAVAVYNLGLIDHRVGSMHHKLNDNLFHRLRLFRSGANVSLQVDDLPPANKQPTGTSPDIRDESVPIIIRNGKIKVFLKLKSAFWKFQTITVSYDIRKIPG